MKKQIYVFILALLIGLSATVTIHNDFRVEATGGGGSEEYEGIGLNYTFLWNVTEELNNVIHNKSIYPVDSIPKGRGWGTDGDRWTANYTRDKMNEMSNLQDVAQLPIKYIDDDDHSWKNYSTKIEVRDFSFSITHPTETYPYGSPTPVTEIFPIPSGFADIPNNWGITQVYEFENAAIIPLFDLSENRGENWPLAGTFTNHFFNLSGESLNYDGFVVGNVSYIEDNDTLPDFQDGMVFIMNESNDCVQKIENITNATGCILLHDDSRGYQYQKAEGQMNFSIVRIEEDENNDNLTNITNMLKNGEIMLVDNYLDNEILTFTYNLTEQNSLPSYECFFFTDNFSIPKTISIPIWWFNLFFQSIFHCNGFIVNDSYDTHEMSFSVVDWDWFQKGNDVYGNWLALPVFSVNASVGKWLFENSSSIPFAKATGYLDQVYKKQTKLKPGVESYNVVGHLYSDKSDDITVISNRVDAWWGECPGDSGLGAGIVLGVAKYFNDFDIKPRCDLTFLMTTGEEYGMRGAQHYVDSHEDDNENTILWIGTDQLGMKQPGVNLSIDCRSSTDCDIVYAIVNASDYVKRSKGEYGAGVHKRTPGGTEAWVWGKGSDICDTISFSKSYKFDPVVWTWHHRTGANYANGDSLININRSDANFSFEVFWNITKYYCVDPDCWFNNYSITLVDSDDVDSLLDTVRFDFNVTSTLPHDLAMVNSFIGSMASYPPPVIKYDNINFTINRNAKSKTVNVTLSAGKAPGLFVFLGELYNSTGRIDEIIDSSGDNDNQTAYSNIFFLYPYGYGYIPPVITNVTNTPDTVGYGFNVTINADVTPTESPIDMVTVNISYPDDTLHSYNMTNTTGDTYEYVFNDTWQLGQYDYIIWAKDINGNETGSSTHSFNVTINATISVCTIKDSYGDNESINITDPPSDPSMIGYELLDNNKVLHIWNKYDDYYFNTSNGVQFTNHYNEFWSHNVLMLGYYNNDMWNLVYRTDELCGFNKNITSDDMSFVNATLWKDLSYMGYDFRLAIRYYLGVDDNELTVIPYIKNIDNQNIPYVLGFAWEINNISVDMTPGGDYIEINGTSYYLNQQLDETYDNMDVPCYYIREDITNDRSESLYLRWDENLDDIVTVESREGEYNAPVTLGIKIGTLSVGQEKYTSLFWHDASEAVYYFDAYSAGEAWATNPGFMTDGSTSNYASTTSNNDVELCSNNTCNGSYLGIISKVEIRAFGYYTGSQRDIILRPVFKDGDGNNHYFSPRVGSGDWSQWFDITSDNNAPATWLWSAVKTLDCDVESGPGMWPFTLYCSKIEIRMTYTNNSDPVISNPNPASGSIGIGIQPILNITVTDPDGDNMNITWLSNSSGSWQVFGTTNNVTDGTYNMNMTNASVNGQWWYWRINVSDGLNYTLSDVFSFYTGYESKIKNCGSTDFKGYLLMQVQFYNNSSWVVVNDTVNETTPRTIKWASPGGTPGQEILGLDTIFNGLVNTNNLSGYGNGTYKIYACLRDPMGNVLNAGGGVFGSQNNYLESDYEFTITYS